MPSTISVGWKDADGNEISRDWGPEWTATLSATGRTHYEMTAPAPANATQARFVITQFDGSDAGAGGAFLIDDASATENP